MRALTRFELIAAIVSFALIFVCGAAKEIAVRRGVDEAAADKGAKAAILLLFFIFGLSCIGLMVHLFVVLQRSVGNAGAPMVGFLAAHETGVTLVMWGFMGLGILIALPFILKDMVGLSMPLRSGGVLVADIGMSLDEVRARSTLRIKDPRAMPEGAFFTAEDVTFDYRVGDSSIIYPQSRYYWIWTGKHGDSRITSMNMGITPRKLPKAELENFQRKLQHDLLADGWMPGHYVARTEETVRLWGGKRTTGDGRFWLRRNTVLIFNTRRIDEEKRDEPRGSGEFILYLDLRPREDEKDVVFELSAWH
jgi:hypothetical protein